MNGRLIVVLSSALLLAPLGLVASAQQPALVAKDETREESPAVEIKIFRLENISGLQAMQLLEPFYDEITLSADGRTNSLVVKATEGRLEEIEALLARLDEQPRKAPRTYTDSGASARRPAASVAALRNKYHKLERDAARLAKRLRESGRGETDELKQLVDAAFQARQDLQRAELAALRKRFDTIESQIEARERLKGKIVERRVEELLDPALEWEPAASPRSQTAGATADAADDATSTASNTTGGGKAAEAASAHPPAQVFDQKVQAAQSKYEFAERLYRKNYVSRGELDVAKAALETARAEARAAEIRRVNQEQVLTIELEEAKERLKVERDKLGAIERAGPGVVSEAAAGEQASEVRLAELAVARARTQLETFHKLHGEPQQATDKDGDPEGQIAKEIEVVTSDLDVSVGVFVRWEADKSDILAKDRKSGRVLFVTEVSGRAKDIQVSADLKRVGVFLPDEVRVYDLRTGKSLGVKSIKDWRKDDRPRADTAKPGAAKGDETPAD